MRRLLCLIGVHAFAQEAQGATVTYTCTRCGKQIVDRGLV